ncbi:MAG: 2'-5' RNA ligase family protein [Candidatus Woesebacteria bacterium]|jgi:2'-5' RNA ligase
MSKLDKTIDTCLSAGTRFDIKEIAKAKKYLKKYDNRYDLPPHLTYAISPFPEKNLKKVEKESDKYFKNLKSFSFKIGKLEFDERKNFFYLPIKSKKVMRIHKDMLELLNKYREGYIREKDLERIEKGLLNPEEIKLIKKYGYFRVLDNFIPHLTIGNVEAKKEEIVNIKNELIEILKNLSKRSIQVNEVRVHLHTDSKIQSKMKSIWIKRYQLFIE